MPSCYPTQVFMPRRYLVESLIAGTAAALAMMPAGFIFRALGMRVGHYGPKFAGLYLTDPGPLALFAQHLVLGWVSVLPLCWLAWERRPPSHAVRMGAVYGAAYYVAVNSLALPLYFGDPLPWQLGIDVMVPSLVVHIVFGVVAAWAMRWWRLRVVAAPRLNSGT